jgi:DNA-directed RNA polymerase specialized sigma24 family protein
MNRQLDHRASERMIKKFGHQVLRRVRALGANGVSLEDVEQELWIAWCVAADKWSPDGGCSFATYLTTGMRRHANRWILDNFERFHDQTTALSLDSGGPMSRAGTDEMDSVLGDIVPDQHMQAEELVIRASVRRAVMADLSLPARQMLNILENPPDEVMLEFGRLEAKAKWAQEIGAVYPRPSRLTRRMVCDLMGLTRTQREQVLAEIEQAVKEHTDE